VKGAKNRAHVLQLALKEDAAAGGITVRLRRTHMCPKVCQKL